MLSVLPPWQPISSKMQNNVYKKTKRLNSIEFIEKKKTAICWRQRVTAPWVYRREDDSWLPPAGLKWLLHHEFIEEQKAHGSGENTTPWACIICFSPVQVCKLTWHGTERSSSCHSCWYGTVQPVLLRQPTNRTSFVRISWVWISSVLIPFFYFCADWFSSGLCWIQSNLIQVRSSQFDSGSN